MASKRKSGGPHLKRSFRTAVVTLWVVYAQLMGYFVVAAVLGRPMVLFLLPLATLAFFGFSLGHAVWSLGGRQAFLFLAITFTVSLAFESVGVLTGWVYGPYHYTDRLGFKLFGLVPLLIPIAWFMMIYPSHVLAGRVMGNGRAGGWRRLLWLAALSALAMTAWDLVMDPVMVAGGHWVWEVEGAYFGVPLHNYVGWLATTLVVFLLYNLWAARRPGRPWGDSSRFFQALPILAYAVTWLGQVSVALGLGLAGPALAGFFGMGSFALIGLGEVWGRPGDAAGS
ncbi:MAG: carotenoid biosynthesis protein [Chloroflexota bacterium]